MNVNVPLLICYPTSLVWDTAEVDPLTGKKIIKSAVSKGVLEQAKKALTLLFVTQTLHGMVGCISPRDMTRVSAFMKDYDQRIRYQTMFNSGADRLAGCVLRDAYRTEEFIPMCEDIWRNRDMISTSLRDLFSITARHNMLLRDEDLRHLELQNCFTRVIKSSVHHGSQTAVALIFGFRVGKTNKDGRVMYACALRHEDVSRCAFSAFAFYMLERFQVHEVTINHWSYHWKWCICNCYWLKQSN